MGNPGKTHLESVKWVLRYLKGSADRCMRFKTSELKGDVLLGYVDADYAANIDTRKSLTGFVFTLFGTRKLEHKSQISSSIINYRS